jgi:hypothetical protein
MTLGMAERPVDPRSVLSLDAFKLLLSDLQTGTSEESAEIIFRMLDIGEQNQVSVAEIVDILIALAPRELVEEFGSQDPVRHAAPAASEGNEDNASPAIGEEDPVREAVPAASEGEEGTDSPASEEEVVEREHD